MVAASSFNSSSEAAEESRVRTREGNDRYVALTSPDADRAMSALATRFFASSRVLFGVLDFDGTIIEANESWHTILGHEPELLRGKSSWDYVEPGQLSHEQGEIERLLNETGQATSTLSMRRADGEYRDIEWQISWDQGAHICFSVGRDVTDERMVAERLRDSDRFFSLAADYLVVFDFDGGIRRINDAVCRGLNTTHEAVAETPLLDFIHPEDQTSAINAVAMARRLSQTTWTGRVMRGTEPHWVETTLVHDVSEDVIILVGRDVTKVLELTTALKQRAETDTLTGLPNRNQFTNLIDQALAVGLPAVLFCDLDRFKVVNDSLGHIAGDTLLQILGRRLESLSKRTGTTVARIGGDEFVVLIDSADVESATELAHQFRAIVKDPFVIRGNRMFVDTCVGVAVCPAVGAMTSEDLLSAADTAVYSAKSQGPGKIVVFDSELQDRAHSRFTMELELRSAVEDDRLLPYLQPIVDLDDGRIVSAEALVRLHLLDGSQVPPLEFLHVAEETGLLPAIDQRTLRFALSEALVKCPGVSIAVNVSAAQIVDPMYATIVGRLAEHYEVGIEHLIFELTESSMLTDVETTTQNLQQLRDLGARTALDDFGTGYSALSHLRDFPIDIVKIDREFTASFLGDRATRAVVEGVLSVCNALGMTVVAEGVETEAEAEAMRNSGCHLAQGWLYHRPMPVDDLTALLT